MRLNKHIGDAMRKMINCLKVIFAAIAAVPSMACADGVGNITPELVMAGPSSAIGDATWIRVVGNVGHANCSYGSWSLFYARAVGGVDPKKVLAIALSAKMSGRTVAIEYINNSLISDFYGFGISSCEIQRIAMY